MVTRIIRSTVGKEKDVLKKKVQSAIRTLEGSSGIGLVIVIGVSE